MRHALSIIACLCILSVYGLDSQADQRPTPVAPNGETVISARLDKRDIRVIIKTHEIQIGTPNDKRPDVIRTSCTYSKYPCSIVDYIDILVDNNRLFVPRSAFCDLADLSTVEIKIGQKKSTLILVGGDASESYIAKIEFDSTHIKNQNLAPLESPAEPLQKTTYYVRVLGD